jgi:2-polyprenyl-6-methoxyphenol hydroxylase-like FAD-dependent oxidoreductase
LSRSAQTVVVGAGPTGLLAASVLVRQQQDVIVVERPVPRRPQNDHVHLIGTQVLDQIAGLSPGFDDALREAGSPVADVSALDIAAPVAGNKRLWPSRYQVDAALGRIVEQHVEIVRCGVREVSWRSGSWHLELSNGQLLTCQRLIDASGRRRVCLEAITERIGHALSLDTGPRGGGYVSLLLENVDLPQTKLGLRVRGDPETPGVLLLRETNQLCRMTLQLPPGYPLPEHASAALRLLTRLPDEHVQSALAGAACAGPLSRFGAQAAEILDLSAAAPASDDWLVMGDALACTPPYLGWGIAQACQQVKILFEGTGRGERWLDIRQKQHQAMNRNWLQATTQDALVSLLTG